jgi:hypothetical protein
MVFDNDHDPDRPSEKDVRESLACALCALTWAIMSVRHHVSEDPEQATRDHVTAHTWLARATKLLIP